MIVMELVPGGSLLNFLRNNGASLATRSLLGNIFLLVKKLTLAFLQFQQHTIYIYNRKTHTIAPYEGLKGLFSKV
jgi:hypothetical protein